MEKALDQSEIDTIFASARADAAEATSAAEASAPQPPERFNFGRSAQITRDQLRAISAVNDLFAHNATHSLGAWLRSRFDVALVSAEQMTWSEFTALVPETAYLCSTDLDPLDATGALQFDLALAPAVVDLLLGGAGRPGALREPTEIEDAILVSAIEVLVREFNSVWQTVGLKFTLGQRERDTQIVNLMPGTERILCISFEVRMNEVQGSIHLCLPAVVLSTLLRRPASERRRHRSGDTRMRLQHLLLGAGYDASLQFPSMQLNARALADLTPGKLLPLPLARQSTAELRVAGLPLFEAMPVRMGDRRGAQIKFFAPGATGDSV